MQHYCVVRMNSTSGAWIVERCAEDVFKWSKAEIFTITTKREEAEEIAEELNKKEE